MEWLCKHQHCSSLAACCAYCWLLRGKLCSKGCTSPSLPACAVSQRPPQVSRLNLGSSSSLGGRARPEERRPLAGGDGIGNTGGRPPMAKLNLQKLQPPQPQASDAVENRTPLSARGTPGSARRASPSASSTNWLTEGSDASDLSGSEDDSPVRGPAGAAPSLRGAAGTQQQTGSNDDPFQLVMSPPRPLTARSAAAAAASSGAGMPAPGLAAVGRLPLHQLRRSGGGSGSQLPQVISLWWGGVLRPPATSLQALPASMAC